jgi:hypothetical protein
VHVTVFCACAAADISEYQVLTSTKHPRFRLWLERGFFIVVWVSP